MKIHYGCDLYSVNAEQSTRIKKAYIAPVIPIEVLVQLNLTLNVITRQQFNVMAQAHSVAPVIARLKVIWLHTVQSVTGTYLPKFRVIQ
ncbi:hypothetical protein CO615_04050 [Lysobacteraceae bacterium NML75-0749]|nr:hypothetical protein CO615_04050 [Xanthomonadaceae bacterium NML75-0749]